MNNSTSCSFTYKNNLRLDNTGAGVIEVNPSLHIIVMLDSEIMN